jgi:hypothetical protein
VPGISTIALAAALTLGSMQRAPLTGLEFRLFTHASMTDREIARLREVVDQLVTPAALATTWHDCDREPARCAQRAGTVVQVFLKRHTKPGRPLVCGEVARDVDMDLPSVIVYVGCARAVADELGRRARDPRLLSVRVEDVVGLTLAHELGHLWGLRHSATGLMKARHDATDLVALRSSRLAMAPDEAQRLARAIRDGQALYVRH